MRTILNSLRFSSCAARVSLAVYLVLTLSLCAAVSSAQQKPIVLSQTTVLGALPSGGSESSSNPVGGTMAVTSHGDAIVGTTYGSQVVLFDGKTGKTTILATPSSQSGAVAVDGHDNLFIGFTYGGDVVKLPYVNGAYAAWSAPGASTPACTGSDTVECSMVNVTAGATSPIVSLAFDSQGDLFFGIQADSANASTKGITNPNTIWECAATTCLYASGGTPTKIFTEPAPTATPGLNYQLTLGGLAVDQWGNVFYTDGLVDGTSDSTAGDIYATNLNELPWTGTGFGTATVLYTNSQASSPGAYVDAVTGVNVDVNGTVYFTDIYDGVVAIPNTGAALTMAGVASSMYTVSTQGLKLFALDKSGTIYGTSYSSAANGDAMYKSTMQYAFGGSSPLATSVTSTNLVVIDNLGGCVKTPAGPVINFTATENGATSTEFTGIATTGTCGGTLTGGSDYSVTMTFDPSVAGERQAILTASDTTNSGSGTSELEGIGQGPVLTLDPGVITSYTTGFTTPAAVVADAKGNLFVADSGANAVYEIASGSTTPTAIGSGFKQPSDLAFDAAGNLFVADSGNNQIVELVENGVSGSVDGSSTQIVFVSSSTEFGGKTLDFPEGIAFGSEGAINITDTLNNRVVRFNPNTGFLDVRDSVPGAPGPIAIDAQGTLYVGQTTGNTISVFSDSGPSTITPTGLSIPSGLAADASGSLFVADSVGNLWRIPNEAGALNLNDGVSLSSAYLGLAGGPAWGAISLDQAGNLYIPGESKPNAVNVVTRNAASVNVGNVDDDSTGSASVYVESAGNTALKFPSPIFTAPTPASSHFTLAGGTTEPCRASSGAVGTACDLTATFAPTNDLAASTLTATSTVSTTNAGAATVTMTGTNVFENLTLQTIAFTPPASIAYTTKPITLSATATSGLAVTFTLVSGPATLSGSTLTITGVGPVVIEANQAGNSTFAPAPTVRATIHVVKATQSITFTPKTSFTYPVTTPYTLTATDSAGLPVRFAVISGPATITSKDELKITAAGTIRVSANQLGNADYDAAAQVIATITVHKATQTITFDKITVPATYGAKITLVATSTSNLPVTFSVISGPATIIGNDVLKVTGVGPIKVGAVQLGNADYDAAVEKYRTPTAIPASLDVIATNEAMTEGGKVPALKYTIVGFVNGDKESKVVTGKASLTTTATSSSKPGTYPIDVALGTLALTPDYTTLYTFVEVKGTMTVNK
jgi:sugar lactone lactonase YvrE